jgi:hypothetical protein
VTLGARPHQRRADSLPVEADDVFDVMERQAHGGMLVFFDDHILAIQREVGFRGGDIENVREMFHKISP